MDKKFTLLLAAPDILGEKHYFVSNGEIMSPRAYSTKLHAELVCASMNGDDVKLGDIASNLLDFVQKVAKVNNPESLETLRGEARKLLDGAGV
jgi:hypothetical protein